MEVGENHDRELDQGDRPAYPHFRDRQRQGCEQDGEGDQDHEWAVEPTVQADGDGQRRPGEQGRDEREHDPPRLPGDPVDEDQCTDGEGEGQGADGLEGDAVRPIGGGGEVDEDEEGLTGQHQIAQPDVGRPEALLLPHERALDGLGGVVLRDAPILALGHRLQFQAHGPVSADSWPAGNRSREPGRGFGAFG